MTHQEAKDGIAKLVAAGGSGESDEMEQADDVINVINALKECETLEDTVAILGGKYHEDGSVYWDEVISNRLRTVLRAMRISRGGYKRGMKQAKADGESKWAEIHKATSGDTSPTVDEYLQETTGESADYISGYMAGMGYCDFELEIGKDESEY